MYEHVFGYTVSAALELARSLKYGPLPAAGDRAPSPKEAIELIRQERRGCGFNWITGEVAEAVLRAYVAGQATAAETVSPYPDWSDEHRAWREGKESKTEP